MVKIIDKHDRKVLAEGRDNGMAFAFLQEVGDEFHTVQPPSPCKDYLAEVVFTEKYDIPTKGCGLSYPKKLGIFSDCSYMVIKIMKTKSSGYSYGYSFEEDVDLLKENYKHAERLLNDFEKELELKVLTTIESANDDYFLVKFSADWCQSTHSISLYSLLLRVLMVATEWDKDIMSFLESYSYHGGDKSFLAQNMEKIELILAEKKLPVNTSQYSKAALEKFMRSPHHNGIGAWQSSFEEVPLGD